MCTKLLGTNGDEIFKQIFKEFNKTEDDLQECINIMREWAKTQLHFPEIPNDRILRFVILYNKFSIETSKQKLDMYYTMKSLMPEVYSLHPLSPDMILQSKITYCVPLPKVTSDCKRIIYSQLNPNYGPEVFVHEKYFIHVHHMMEVIVQEDNCFSFHFIFDCAGLKAGHLPKFSPMVLRKASILLEKVYSNRVASVYMINFHPFMETLLNNIILPTLSPKIRERVRVHKGTNVLFETFGKSRMPKDVGGEELSLAELNDLLLKKFEQYKDRFNKIRTMRVDESLRPEKLVNDDILGYYGNFRKIAVD
ncbi:uncharacterized protein LOC115885028 [Sitophilus oryzae]|uniref:Uncharacterized protein LOC115885028 n=1 Tax=Sitophilus oryzae TaxID=7048 RepID=A0A6J2Y8S7_SITOR|nr:uncharacterized protein LOC115885028 [Sitophilus oryzae]